MNVSIDNVRFNYEDGTKALQGVTASIASGSLTGIIGPNGSGKSTLLLAIAGVLTAEGRIVLGELEVLPAGRKEIRQRVGLVFQDAHDQLFMPTVLQDVAFGPLNSGLSDDESLARAREALQQVGLADVEDKAPYHLSVGQQKLVAIATVLSMRPDILLLDEPTSALDHRSRRTVIQILSRLKMTRLVATHDLEMLVELADEVIILDDGRDVTHGRARTVLGRQDLLAQHGLEMPHSLLHRQEHISREDPHSHGP